jgi:alanine-glyoxylate transaminase/serine-glyoxylate transaminase/serine-pyruvate transaminase
MPDRIEAPRYPGLEMSPRVLLGPGPSTVHPRVLQAMAAPVIGHLDPAFLQVMDRIQDMLRYVFQTRNPLTIPISGSGSAAMEAAVANSVEPGQPVLVCMNGYFGGRLAEMARRYGGQVETLECPWGEAIDLEQIRVALRRRPARVVAIVHGETSSGVQQPLEGLAEVVHDQGGLLLVDCVASLGGVPLAVDELGIDLCYGGSQKCLSVPPGLGPITLGPRAEQALRDRKSPVPNWYLDLSMVQQYWGADRTYHHTAPISANFGLYEGLRMLTEEGLEASWARHRRNAELLWAGLEAMGLTLHVPLEHRLPPLTTVRVPPGVDEPAVRRRLLQEFNIEIAGGLGELKGKVWRIGLMGHSSRAENVKLLLTALREILQA